MSESLPQSVTRMPRPQTLVAAAIPVAAAMLALVRWARGSHNVLYVDPPLADRVICAAAVWAPPLIAAACASAIGFALARRGRQVLEPLWGLGALLLAIPIALVAGSIGVAAVGAFLVAYGLACVSFLGSMLSLGADFAGRRWTGFWSDFAQALFTLACVLLINMAIVYVE